MNRTYTLDQVKKAQSISINLNIPIDDALDQVWRTNWDKERAIHELSYKDARQMTKAEIIEATWTLPPLDDSLYALLKDTGFKTGSTVYAPDIKANDEDWCVCIAPNAFSGHAIGLGDQGYWEQDGFTSIYAHYNGVLQNIICFSDYNLFSAWLAATETLAHLATLPATNKWIKPFGELFNKKWCRVRVFRAIKDICTHPKPLNKPLDKAEALQYSKCAICGQEAINFTCKAAKDLYLESGICERCNH